MTPLMKPEPAKRASSTQVENKMRPAQSAMPGRQMQDGGYRPETICCLGRETGLQHEALDNTLPDESAEKERHASDRKT